MNISRFVLGVVLVLFGVAIAVFAVEQEVRGGLFWLGFLVSLLGALLLGKLLKNLSTQTRSGPQ